MELFTVPAPSPEEPLAVQTTALDGGEFVLKFDWNERVGAWFLDVDTVDGEPIVAGKMLVANWNILRSVAHALRPGGRIYVLTRDGRTPDLTELSTLAQLVFVKQAPQPNVISKPSRIIGPPSPVIIAPPFPPRITGGEYLTDVKAYGAEGYGRASDSRAIQRAADALPDNGTLFFPPGVYLLDETSPEWDNEAAGAFRVLNRRNITVRGDGATLIRGSGHINGRLGAFEDCPGLTVRGLSFDQRGLQRYGGLFIMRCDGVRVQDCRWTDSAFVKTAYDHYACTVQLSSDVRFERNSMVRSKIELNDNRNCYIGDNLLVKPEGSQGIAMIAVNPNPQSFINYIIERNTIEDAEGDAIGIGCEAIGLKTFDGLKIRGNTIRYTGEVATFESGISITTPSSGTLASWSDILIEDNTISYPVSGAMPVRPAILMFGQLDSQAFNAANILNNTILGYPNTTHYAIQCQFFKDSQVRGNRVIKAPGGVAATLGISTFDMSRCHVRDNHVQLVETTSIGYAFSNSGGKNRFQDNTHEGGTSPYGVEVVESDYATAEQLLAVVELDPVLIANGAFEDQEIPVEGCKYGDLADADPDGSPGNGISWQVFVYTPGTLRVRLTNNSGGSVTTFARTWRAVVTRVITVEP